MRFLWCFLLAALVLAGSMSSPAYGQADRVDEKELRLWADRGDPDAQFELGLRLVTGEGLKKAPEEGVEWVRKAADQNHLRAQHVMGSLYEEGLGVKQDLAKAVEWYRKSANYGFAMAQHSLGIMYDLGKGVEKDPAEAAVWFRKAANQDHPPSQAAYASKLERGDGLEKNTPKAALWYLHSAQNSYVPAMTRLAYLYYTGVGVPQDYRRAGAWYQRAARGGDPWAANDLAWFLSTCPDERYHDGETAVSLAKQALKVLAEGGDEERYEMLDTMAAALARNADFLGAVLWQKRAISLLGEDKQINDEIRTKLRTEFDERLKSYQKQQPFTEHGEKVEEKAEPLPGDTILQEESTPNRKQKPKAKPSTRGGTVV